MFIVEYSAHLNDMDISQPNTNVSLGTDIKSLWSSSIFTIYKLSSSLDLVYRLIYVYSCNLKDVSSTWNINKVKFDPNSSKVSGVNVQNLTDFRVQFLPYLNPGRKFHVEQLLESFVPNSSTLSGQMITT